LVKILTATAENGKVTAEGVEVQGVILGAGVAKSTGILILDGTTAFYLASSAPDIDETLEKLISLVTDLAASTTTIANTLTAIGAGMTGPSTAPPPTLPTSVADIQAKVTSFNAIKTELETLKGKLT
jgi:hypothetical protein